MSSEEDFGNSSDSDEEGLVKDDSAVASNKRKQPGNEPSKTKKKKRKTDGGKQGGFIDDAAVESGSEEEDSDDEEGDDDNNDYERDGFVVDEEDEEPEIKSKAVADAEGLEDSDDDDLDDDDDDEGGGTAGSQRTKKLKRLRDVHVLDEDDLDLINEARGLPTDRELAARREKEEAELEKERVRSQTVTGKDEVELSKGLFTGDSSDEEGGDGAKKKKASGQQQQKQQTRPEKYDEDGLDDFIEDDIGDQDDIQADGGRGANSGYYNGEMMEGGVSEAQLNEASEIFGTDYLDFMDGGANDDDEDPFDEDYMDEKEGGMRRKSKKFRERGVGVALGVDSDEEIEEDSDSDDDDDDDADLFGEDDMGEDMGDKQRAEVLRLKREKKRMAREERRRLRKQKIEAKRKAKLRRAFEPVQLVENFCTEKDDAIRMADCPERYYDWLEVGDAASRRSLPVVGEEIGFEEEEEAMWIMGKIPAIQSEYYAISATNLENPSAMDSDEVEKKERAILESIVNSLRYMRAEKLEPDFIKRYRMDYVTSPAVRDNLYRIMDEDSEWERMTEARTKIETILNGFADEVKGQQDTGSGEDRLLRLKEELRIAQEKLDETVKDEERVTVELGELDNAKGGAGVKEEEDDDDELFGDDDEDDSVSVVCCYNWPSVFELLRETWYLITLQPQLFSRRRKPRKSKRRRSRLTSAH